MLTATEQKYLLGSARQAISEYLVRGRITHDAEAAPQPLRAPAGAFVTLRRDRELRGCIGQIVTAEPLLLVVRSMAVAAAFEDRRFSPLTAAELPRVTIEISVLSPLYAVTDINDICVGRDGLLIRVAHHSGLLLPQVAGEFGWDRQEFLAQTCRKAGLSATAWQRDGAAIYRFTANVFSEADPEQCCS